MSTALAYTRAQLTRRVDPVDMIRKTLVLFCGATLAAAGPLLPTLG